MACKEIMRSHLGFEANMEVQRGSNKDFCLCKGGLGCHISLAESKILEDPR